MNEKLKSILEARKKSKAAKSGFKQTSSTNLKGLEAPKKGLSGAGPEAAKVPVKPKGKKMNESNIPAFGARFNKLVESTLASHGKILSEDDASDLYYEFNDELSMGDAEAAINDEQGAETVTLTLDKQTAKKLHELLMAAIGEEDEDNGDEVEEEGYGEEMKYNEGEENEVVEEEGSYQITQANLGAGAKLANAGSKVVKSKLGMRPGKAGTVKTYDSSGKLVAAPTYKDQGLTVKSNMSGQGKDLF
jgi:hypothetical protein